MRYRRLDANGDYTFGQSERDFLVDSPASVAQLVQTTFRLWQGEWFLDSTAGVPYLQAILQNSNEETYDFVISRILLGVEGVIALDSYASTVNNRELSVNATITTQYGTTPITFAF